MRHARRIALFLFLASITLATAVLATQRFNLFNSPVNIKGWEKRTFFTYANTTSQPRFLLYRIKQTSRKMRERSAALRLMGYFDKATQMEDAFNARKK